MTKTQPAALSTSDKQKYQAKGASPVSWCFHHVYGHQSGEDLDIYAQLNNQMDEACKRYWETSNSTETSTQITDPTEWSCWTTHKVTSKLTESLFNWCLDRSALEYWNHRIGREATASVDWEVTATAMKKLQPARQRWLAKQSTGMFASGKMMKNRDARLSAACPRCGAYENSEHILRCITADTTKRWTQHMTDLENMMTGLRTCPTVKTEMIQGLTQWRLQQQEEDMPGNPQSQQQVGWRSLLEGRPALEWRIRQQQYWTSKGLHQGSTKRWMTQILLKLISIAWDLWEHRNGILHNKECHLLSEQIDQEIWQIIARIKKTTYLKLPRRLQRMTANPQEVIQKDLTYKKQWVLVVTAGFERELRRDQQENKELRQQQRGLRAWLRSVQQSCSQDTSDGL
jgi:hypothetical protein